MAKNRTIGIDNTLPWRIPADMQHFKRLTMGHHLIMGRRRSIPSAGRFRVAPPWWFRATAA